LTAINEFRSCGEDLERLLKLRTSPIAVKMIEKETDIPPGAYRPRKDHGVHLAQCQAFAMSRRDKATVAMLKEDHWCPAALMAYGLVERPAVRTGHPYDSFEFGKYIGVLTAPLKSAAFTPDVVIIYSNTAQLRSLLLTFKLEDLPLVNGHFFPPSCAYAVVHVMLTGQYWAVLPDPGEYQRALTGEDEMMFGVPADKVKGLVSRLQQAEGTGLSYSDHNVLMMADFPHPDFYQKMFKMWGLDVKEGG
jgi:uncharacterized protein (DUF169 family)